MNCAVIVSMWGSLAIYCLHERVATNAKNMRRLQGSNFPCFPFPSGRSNLQSGVTPAAQAWSQVALKAEGGSAGLRCLCWLPGGSRVLLVDWCSVLPGECSCVTLGLLFLPFIWFVVGFFFS